jgi:HSP20 family molecular chaperone IbpA
MTQFYSNNFDAIFDEFLFGFGKPKNLKFNCKTKDVMPSYFEKTETGYKCTCRTVGINPGDVKIKLEDDYIHVEGKTTMDGYEYSTSYDLPISQDVANNIKGIKYKTENGITIIYIDLERPDRKIVNIEQI